MPKNAKDELEWQRLDLQLDRELEATFPASDALKITLRQPDTSERGEHPKVKKNQLNAFVIEPATPPSTTAVRKTVRLPNA
jgi:hypothetical protein